MNPNVRRRLAATVVPLLLLASACGGDDDDGASTAPSQQSDGQSSAPAAADEVLSQEQLQSALLTVQDLPTGYEQGTVSSEQDSATGSDDADCATRFQELDELEETAVASAEAEFKGPQFGTVLGQKLASFRSEAEISARIEEVSAVLAACPTFTSTAEDGVTSTATISALDFPELGDETVGLSVALERPGFTAAVNVVVIRVGTSLQLLSQGGLSTDAAALEQAARAGSEKLQSAG